VYCTDGMGLGLKAAANIGKGSFVCEYMGEIISKSEADTREGSYLFDMDNRASSWKICKFYVHAGIINYSLVINHRINNHLNCQHR